MEFSLPRDFHAVSDVDESYSERRLKVEFMAMIAADWRVGVLSFLVGKIVLFYLGYLIRQR